MTRLDDARPTTPRLLPGAPTPTATPTTRHADRSGPADVTPDDATPPALTVRAFLAEVAAVLQGGLPRRVWIEATIVTVKAGPYGHAIEIVDPTPSPHPPHLRVFLPHAERKAIDGQFGFAIEPTLLLGLTTCLLIEPRFDPKWHLSGKVVGLARSAATSLRQRLLDEAVVALKRERLFDRQRALRTPRDVTRIAVVHPPGSAGMADIADKLSRWQAAGVLIVRAIPTPFEGGGAAQGLIDALQKAVQPLDGYSPDLVLIVRGGGAKAGLLVFDDVMIARAVCLMPIPVMSGIGHAVDESLVDRVAWRSVATPSMAVGLVGSVIAAAAWAAEADHQSIVAQARQQLAAGALALAGTRQRIDAGLERHLTAVAAALASCWSAVLVDVTRTREQAERRADAATQLLRDVRAAAPLLLGQQEDRLRRRVTEALDRAWRSLGRHDAGLATMTAAGHAARAQLDRLSVTTDTLRDAVLRHAERLTLDAETSLARLAVVIEGCDLAAVLRRGFALVTDAAGRLLPTRATAALEDRLVLVFADGSLRAAPIGPKRRSGGGEGGDHSER